MKKIIWLTMIIILSLVMITNVNAYGDTQSGDTSTGANCKGGYCWPYVAGTGNVVRGMRISLIKTSGAKYKVNQSVYNVVRERNHINYLNNNSNYYYWKGNCSKVEYMMGTCTLEKAQADSSRYTINNINSLEDAFTPIVSVSSKLYTFQLADIWNKVEEKSFTDEMMINLMQTMFNIDKSMLDEINADKKLKEDLWIVVEPLTYIKYNGDYYLGTEYELGTLGYTNVAGQYSIDTVLGRSLPCAGYVTGNIIKKSNGQAPGVNASNMTYFYGTIGSVVESSNAAYSGTNSFSNICNAINYSTSNILSDYYVNGSAGTGMVLLWYNDTVKETTCSDVNNGITWGYDNLKTTLDSLYKSGGTQAIKNMYPNGIGYKDSNGQTQFANTDWYIYECTCYGVDETYKNSTNVSLFTLPKTNIKTVFNDITAVFDNYYLSTKTNLEKLKNSGTTEEIGQISMWDSDKYLNELSCPYDDTLTSCTKVDFSTLNEGNNSCSSDYNTCYNSCYGYGGLGLSNGGYNSICVLSCQIKRSTCISASRTQDNLVRSCESLPLYGSESFTTLYVRNNTSKYNECFKEYQSQKGGLLWTIDTYQNAGCTTVDSGIEEISKKYDCTPVYGVGTCINGDSINYNDFNANNFDSEDEYWNNCVFSDENAKYFITDHKETDNTKTLSYYDKNMSSKYCETYCIESVVANFDSSVIEVKAGMNFVWNNHSVSGSRTCKTKSIDWSVFANELASDNIAIEKAYNTYLVARDQENSLVATSVSDCPVRHSEEYETTCSTTVDGKKETYPCTKTHHWTTYDGDGTDYSWDESSYGSGSTYVSESGGSNHCGSSPVFNVSSKLATYNKIKEDANDDYNAMTACYDWSEEEVYKIDPVVTIDYSDNTYSYNSKMESNINYTDVSVDNDCTKTTVKVLTNCSGNSCTIETKNINKCSYNNEQRGGNSNFTLEDGVFQYIIKERQLSIHADSLGSYGNINYINLGYSNLPVAYKTKSGIYGEEVNNGKLSLTYEHLGHIETGTTDVDIILSQSDVDYGGDYNDWKCEYKVVSEIFPDEETNKTTDINVIYRPISLENPFPGMEGNGRNTGSNWCYYRDCSNDNDIVTKYITDNRGVEGEEIYSEEPMYTFVLTPAIIKEIRKYNAENNYMSYSGSLNNKTYNFVCEEGTGKNCISEYLSYLIQIAGSGGTCSDTKYRNSSNFDCK